MFKTFKNATFGVALFIVLLLSYCTEFSEKRVFVLILLTVKTLKIGTLEVIKVMVLKF